MNADNLHLVSLGEILIDFTPSGQGFDVGTGNPCYVQNPGGAPANVLSCFAKLGGKASFIGAVGNDSFGVFLKESLVKSSVNAENLVFKDGRQLGSKEINAPEAEARLTAEKVAEREGSQVMERLPK